MAERDRSRSPNRMDTTEWRCSNCKMENTVDRNKCKKCKLEKGTERSEVFTEDWKCSDNKCRANNYSRRLDCFKCHKRKPPADPRFPNDWECMGCRGNNYSKRVDCFKCGQPKPNFMSTRPDWKCVCGGSNYAHRATCHKCGQGPQVDSHFRDNTRQSYSSHQDVYSSHQEVYYVQQQQQQQNVRQRSPLPDYPHPQPAPDMDPVTGQTEWQCPVCGVPNFYKRFDCYRCFEKKPGGCEQDMFNSSTEVTYSTPYLRDTVRRAPRMPPQQRLELPAPKPEKRFPTDWICPDCNGLNFSKRVDCFKCHTVKPVEEGSKKGEWDCPQCQGNNFSRRTECFKCGTPKPDIAL